MQTSQWSVMKVFEWKINYCSALCFARLGFFPLCVFSEKLWSSSWTRETHMSVCKRRATRGDNLIVELWSWIHRNRYEKSFPFVFEQTGLRLCIFFPRALNRETLILNWTILKSQQVFWSESFDSELTLTESIQWILNIWSIWLKRLCYILKGKSYLNWVVIFCSENIVYCFFQFYWVINKLSLWSFPISLFYYFIFIQSIWQLFSIELICSSWWAQLPRISKRELIISIVKHCMLLNYNIEIYILQTNCNWETLQWMQDSNQ